MSNRLEVKTQFLHYIFSNPLHVWFGQNPGVASNDFASTFPPRLWSENRPNPRSKMDHSTVSQSDKNPKRIQFSYELLPGDLQNAEQSKFPFAFNLFLPIGSHFQNTFFLLHGLKGPF
jgi:hypothetical protein